LLGSLGKNDILLPAHENICKLFGSSGRTSIWLNLQHKEYNFSGSSGRLVSSFNSQCIVTIE
jgi:hypothetical protein